MISTCSLAEIQEQEKSPESSSPGGTGHEKAAEDGRERPRAEDMKIRAGSILIEEGIIFPSSLRIESEPYSKGWRLVRDFDGYRLDRRISEVGWSCFYMASEMTASAVALDGERSLSKAVNQILTQLKLERFNSLEITQVATKRFLGLPHTTVVAHARHIQESIFLFDWKAKQQGHQEPASTQEKTAS